MAEKLNGPGFGFRMAVARQEVSTADVARQVITRMSEAAITREHQLHALLAEWDELARDSDPAGMAFEQCADQLREILGTSK